MPARSTILPGFNVTVYKVDGLSAVFGVIVRVLPLTTAVNNIGVPEFVSVMFISPGLIGSSKTIVIGLFVAKFIELFSGSEEYTHGDMPTLNVLFQYATGFPAKSVTLPKNKVT